MKNLALLILLFANVASLWGQSVSVPFDADQWQTENAQFSLQQYEGKESILLQSGSIYLADVSFLDGTIDVDINFSGVRNFPGVRFRMQDMGNYENFYIRPHQSGNPDANQYTPVFNGIAGWQLYYGEQYATPIHYVFNDWHHLRIVVSGNQAQIYFDDMERPLLEIKELKRTPQAGTLGLGTRTNVHFANFQYTLDQSPVAETPAKNDHPQELVTSWELSNLIDDEEFQEKQTLTNSDLAGLSWNSYPVESSGVLNIARYIQRSEGKNSVLVKLTIRSDRRQIKQLNFGYSDFAKVFVNGQPIYSGANDFVSRDYRYLGTIGYFDSVFLPLKKGDNLLLFLIKENFGGWGLQAVLPDRQGISLD